ncbi:MAG: GNAT family N-acetyltransferase [Bryobacteraceae bacterium]
MKILEGRAGSRRPVALEPERAQVVEDVYAEYLAHLAGVEGLEVHCDPDVAWKVSPAAAWSNCGVRVRFAEKSARKRIETILTRYRTNGRGAGFWVGPAAEPASLESLLTSQGLRCRKYFPAMYCDLGPPLPKAEPKVAIDFQAVTDYSIFRKHPHPSHGRISTAIRRFGLYCDEQLASREPRRAWDLMATHDGVPAGICTLFLGATHAGLFDVGVIEPLRNLGIGRAVVRHACQFARTQGMKGAILIATNMGYGVYHHAGFREVCRVGFWYAAKP